MIRLGRKVWVAIAAVAAVQMAVLGWMVWGRVHLLKTGREVTFEVVPVDPRSLFRGDYVILSYPFSSVRATQSDDVTFPYLTHKNDVVYVTLAPDGETNWKRLAIGRDYPAGVEPGQVVLQGRVDQVWPDMENKRQTGRIRFGIESYFVPEGTGAEIEKQVRDHKIKAVVAVGADGLSAIKALEVDGKRIHEEAPL